MPWTEITREQYRRDELRHARDTTDAEWGLIKRLLPRASRRGRPRRTDPRTVVEAILHILSTGCQWRALPQEFPPIRRCRVILTRGEIRVGGRGSSMFLSGWRGKNGDARQSRQQP
jgi:hypothetical protein